MDYRVKWSYIVRMNDSAIPKWILVVSGLIGVLGVFVGSSLYITPGTFIKDVDFGTSGTRYLAYMWGARQVTLGSILAFSALRRSRPMLQLSLGAYALMNAQDAVIGVWRGDMGLIVGASLFALGPSFMVFLLARTK